MNSSLFCFCSAAACVLTRGVQRWGPERSSFIAASACGQSSENDGTRARQVKARRAAKAEQSRRSAREEEGIKERPKTSQGGAAPGCHRPARRAPHSLRPGRPSTRRGADAALRARARQRSRRSIPLLGHRTAHVRVAIAGSQPIPSRSFSASTRQPQDSTTARTGTARPSAPAPGTTGRAWHGAMDEEGVACPAEAFTRPVQWRGAAFRRCWLVRIRPVSVRSGGRRAVLDSEHRGRRRAEYRWRTPPSQEANKPYAYAGPSLNKTERPSEQFGALHERFFFSDELSRGTKH
ncbi:hypothetical protein SORBI_3006G235801 [Sorghum bicolor]|uniref:Uncharacterized protein n=1 Tax=Sorghum bicolor TaxID=4558 RepID=A0A1Z5RG70_SORBI|nr:hypothetical protein SORBI_3006G235801 [Sorghum bicolor]